MDYTLLDCKQKNLQHPNSFFIPDDEDIEKLKVGDMVKLLFSYGVKPTERMWVKIIEIKPDGFVGKLDNEPVIVPLACGDIIHFESRHIASIFEH